MAKTKKVYPFISCTACGKNRRFELDAREVECYTVGTYVDTSDDSRDYTTPKEYVLVSMKSGNEFKLCNDVDQEVYPGENLSTLIDMVWYAEFWHDNEDSAPTDED